MANILYKKQKQQKSLDNGVTWIDTGEYRVGDIIENPSNCTSDDTKQCRWVELPESEGYYCDGYSKYTMQVEECTENGLIWTRTGNSQRGNTLIDAYTNDCGFVGNVSCFNTFMTKSIGNYFINDYSCFCKNNYINCCQYYNELLNKLEEFKPPYNYDINIHFYNSTYNDGSGIKYLNALLSNDKTKELFYYNNDIKVTIFNYSEYDDISIQFECSNDVIYFKAEKGYTSDSDYLMEWFKVDKNFNVTKCELVSVPAFYYDYKLPKELVFQNDGDFYIYYIPSYYNNFHNIVYSDVSVIDNNINNNGFYYVYNVITKSLFFRGTVHYINKDYCAVTYYNEDNKDEVHTVIIDKYGKETMIPTPYYIITFFQYKDNCLYFEKDNMVYKFDGNTCEVSTKKFKSLLYGYHYDEELDVYLGFGEPYIEFYDEITDEIYFIPIYLFGEYDESGNAYIGDNIYLSFESYLRSIGYDIDPLAIPLEYDIHSVIDSVTRKVIIKKQNDRGNYNDSKNYIYTYCFDDFKKWIDYVRDILEELYNSRLSFEFEGDELVFYTNYTGNTRTATTSPYTTTYRALMNKQNYVHSINFADTNITKINSMMSTRQFVSFDSDFYGCTKLKEVDLSNWNIMNVTNISYMFNSCSNLETVNVSTWDVSKIKDFSGMFRYCDKLRTLYVKQGTRDWWYEVLDDSYIDETKVTIIEV